MTRREGYCLFRLFSIRVRRYRPWPVRDEEEDYPVKLNTNNQQQQEEEEEEEEEEGEDWYVWYVRRGARGEGGSK